jgi:hypothetical protein
VRFNHVASLIKRESQRDVSGRIFACSIALMMAFVPDTTADYMEAHH